MQIEVVVTGIVNADGSVEDMDYSFHPTADDLGDLEQALKSEATYVGEEREPATVNHD